MSIWGESVEIRFSADEKMKGVDFGLRGAFDAERCLRAKTCTHNGFIWSGKLNCIKVSSEQSEQTTLSGIHRRDDFN